MLVQIYQLPTQLAGTVDVFPNFKYMVTGNSLNDVTSAGFLNQVDLQSNPVSVTDILQILYDFNPTTQLGSYNAFSVTIVNGVITLSAEISAGNVILPVVAGNLAEFDDTSGVISDSGISAANVPVLSPLPVVVGDIPIFSSTGGSLTDSGILLTALINRNVQNSFNVSGGLLFNSAVYTAPGGVVSTSTQSGIITTDALTTASGSSYVVTISPFTTLTVNSIVMFQLLQAGTNTAGNNILFTYSVSGFASPIVLNIVNANAASLNGTIVFAYFVIR